ncbi:MAG: tetratricopeptide repeat protein, partial [Chloroflexi bacterium]|nr:tetratricopeptide repeat protein [Chloroflexota bacterium]
ARELAPMDADVLNDLGAAYANANQFLPAIRAFGAALKLAPHNPQALHNLGAILMQAGENAKAEVFLQQARQMEARIRS